MRLMQSKAGMFLRILGSLAIMYIFIVIGHRTSPNPFKFAQKKFRASYDIYLEKMDDVNTQIKSLKKEREELYLFSSPNDVEVEQKIKALNDQVEKLSAEQTALKNSRAQEEQEEEEEWEKESQKVVLSSAYKYAVLFIAGLLFALIFSPEWLSFGLIFGSIFIFTRYNSFVIKHIGSEYGWLYTSIVGALMLALLLYTMIKRHACSACEYDEGKQRGFLWTRFYYFLFYAAVLFSSVFIIERVASGVIEQIATKLSGDFSSEQMAQTWLNLSDSRHELAEKQKELRNRKDEILISGDITREGQKELLDIDQQIASANKTMMDLGKQYDDETREVRDTLLSGKKYAIMVSLFVVLLCIFLAWLVPWQFFQYFLLFAGFVELTSGLIRGIWAFPIIFLLYLLAVLLLFKRQKHICGTL